MNCVKCGKPVIHGVGGYAAPQCMCWATPASTGPTLDVTGTLIQQSEEIRRLTEELAASREREARMREAFCGVETSQFMTDVVTAAGLLEHGKKDKALADRIAEAAFKLNAIAFSEGAQG